MSTPGNVDLSRIPFELTGEGKGPPIVLVPGGLSGWDSWKPHAEILSKKHRVIRVQLLNMAAAEMNITPGPAYSLRSESEALKNTLDSTGVDRINLVGWSHGGAVSLDFALNYTSRLNTLTLIEPAAYWVARAYGEHAEEESQFIALFKSFHQPPTDEDLEKFLRMNSLVPPGVDPRTTPRWQLWSSLKVSLSSLDTVIEHSDRLERLEALLDIPVLLVKGQESKGFNSAGIELIARSLGSMAQKLVLPDGHACHIVAKEQFIAALEDFLSG